MPKVIKTEEENERALAIVESLMQKGEGNMTPEEGALLELLMDLIHDFEEKAYPIPRSEPHEDGCVSAGTTRAGPQRSLDRSRLQEPGVETLVENGPMTKEQAKRVAAFFHAGVDLFI